MAKPKVNTACVANHYADSTERIIEVTGQGDKGCLIAIRNRPDGTVGVDVYRRDRGVEVSVGDPE